MRSVMRHVRLIRRNRNRHQRETRNFLPSGLASSKTLASKSPCGAAPAGTCRPSGDVEEGMTRAALQVVEQDRYLAGLVEKQN